ncbi:MAG: hypothetical protein NC485_14945 [Ruminococcus flavefaciens]|nr:hypothetical protein [Ruminococcus flavefaciens]
MQIGKFTNYMRSKVYVHRGEVCHYTNSSINSRISCLKKLEDYFNIDIDTKVVSESVGIDFLKEIRANQLEDLRHTPLSNAFRHYFECMTGVAIKRIF